MHSSQFAPVSVIKAERTVMAVRQVARVTSRISFFSSTTRFCRRRRRKPSLIQFRGREDTWRKECRVLTTASRTFVMVCRKKGKRSGAKTVSARLENT